MCASFSLTGHFVKAIIEAVRPTITSLGQVKTRPIQADPHSHGSVTGSELWNGSRASDVTIIITVITVMNLLCPC